jgi:DNA-binding NarL/FixJ family response regulator
MTRILIADDHALIREGLRKMLAADPDLEVAGEAADFRALLALVESTPADVALMDINMPGPNALDTLKRIRALRPLMPVLVLSMLPEEQVALDYMIAGAAGYVCKDAATTELLSAVRKVVGGYRYMSAALAQHIARSPAPAHELSPRELQILRLIASGLAVKEIADQLTLSVSTVHTHRARIMDKLKLRSDVELSRYAIRHRLVVWT